MNVKTQNIAGWANFPRTEATVFEPTVAAELQQIVREQASILARGNGKSYGDAALAANVISTLHFREIGHFDTNKGQITCESGVLLSELLKIIVPKGWFLAVTPGIKQITIGGAIASDVHGKNHPTAACFSNHLISFDLVTASGEIQHCSKAENAPLFWQTCGGMGWTGVILRATLQLQRIESAYLHQKTVVADKLSQLFDAFEMHSDWSYAAAWIDCTHAKGRGAVYFARHETANEASTPLYFTEKKKIRVPFYAPSGLLNAWTIRLYNQLYFWKSRAGERSISLDEYFYPLDAIQDWNRLYGRRGFIQYQCCIPLENAREGMANLLKIIQLNGETPFLSVLKRHGKRPAEAIHSFPIEGYSLALDFPRTSGIQTLIPKLDELVWDLGGKIYLTKDACSAPKMGRVSPNNFAPTKFYSLLRGRISQ